MMKHIKWFNDHQHNVIICCDDTLLFGTNLANEMFEYAKGFGIEPKELKGLLLKNVDAIFDETAKESVRKEI